MKLNTFGLVFLLLFSGASARAQAQPAPTPTATPTTRPSEKKVYDELLEQARRSNPALDFTALRVAFYDSPHYHPDTPMMSYRQLWGALSQKNYPQAIEIAESVLKNNFVEVNAHMVAHLAYRETGDSERAQFHKYMADGLLSSIKGKHDGKSVETAYHVISINEEYGLMRSLAVRPIKQALVNDKQHFFDAITVVNPQTNEQTIVYFNVDRVFAWRMKN